MKNNTIDNYRKTVQELLPEINANIEKYRKGNFKIKVLREDGTPVAATVRAEQKKHAFDFGTNVLMLGHMGEKEQEYRDSLIEDTYDARLFAVDWPRDQLYERINRRVDIMVKNGLINEVSSLMKEIEQGENTSVQAIGYKEIAEALRGEIAMSDAIAHLKTASRNYAKRQVTWFKRDARVTWLPVEDTKILAEKIAHIITHTEADNG